MYTIVLAEDDLILRDNLKSFLVQEGYNVLEADNGFAAYTLALCNDIDLIISDYNMPVTDGKELLKKLQESPVTSGIPFIFMSAEPANQGELKDLSNRVNGFLLKPFDLTELLNLIEQNTSKKATHRVYDKSLNYLYIH